MKIINEYKLLWSGEREEGAEGRKSFGKCFWINLLDGEKYHPKEGFEFFIEQKEEKRGKKRGKRERREGEKRGRGRVLRFFLLKLALCLLVRGFEVLPVEAPPR